MVAFLQVTLGFINLNWLNPPDGGVPPSEQLFQDATTPPAAHRCSAACCD